MKKSILIFAFAIFLNLNFLSAQNFQITPAQPQSGESISIKYNPTETDLEGEKVFAVAYVLEYGEIPKAQDLPMAKSDSGYTANFQTPANAQVVVVKFENENGEMKDDNHGEGYHTMLYKNGEPVKNAHAASSTIYGENARTFGLKSDGTKVGALLEKEMTNPADRFSMEYLGDYAMAVRMNKDEKGKAGIIEYLTTTVANEKLSEKDMTKFARVARLLKNTALQKTINEKIKTEFPEGKLAVAGKYEDFRSLETLDEKIAMHKEVISLYGGNEDHKRMVNGMASSIAAAYGKKGDVKNMNLYIDQLTNNSDKAGVYNNVAWGLSGESLEGEGKHVKAGAEMSIKSLQLIEEEMVKQKGKKDFYSVREYKRNMKFSYAMYSDTYALLAYKNGDVKSALKHQTVACEASEMKDATMNARCAVFMEKEKGGKETMVFLEEMIGQGNADSRMKEQFSRLFKANISIDQAADMYLARLEDNARAKKVEEIKKEMINKQAPNFALKNFKGEAVSLESLEGKIVVVDFWATWCGPCKASFPAMQKAVTKYDNAEDVAFVFINTWESGKKQEKAKKFIDGKGYTFDVLMDTENTMVSDYEVSGIPTKFILDKKGNIRYKGTGFGGNDDALVDEISIVVELLRGGGNSHGKIGAQP